MDEISSAERMFSPLMQLQSVRDGIANTTLSSGITLYQNKKYSQAAAAFKQSIALKPDQLDAYNYLAMSYLKLGKTAESIKAYKVSLSIDRNQDSIHMALGNIYMSLNRNSEAENEFKAAAKANPASNLAPYTLGQLYLKTERYAEAEAEFKKVIRMTPKDGNVYYALGQTYNKMGRYDEAVTQLTKALDLKKNFPLANFELGTAYIGLDNKDKAREQLDILQDKDTSLYNELSQSLASPKIFARNSGNSTFNTYLGAGTPLAFLDASLLTPNTSKDFTIQFQFDSEMDSSSVMNITNWSITKATGGVAGTYNNGITLHPELETAVSPIPRRVTYDATTYQATLTFSITQNPYGTGVIDPSHLVFKFSGKGIDGKSMDSSADQYDGFKGGVF